MGKWRRALVWSVLFLVAAAASVALGIHVRYGGGSTDFPDLTGPPRLPALEVVANLDRPPGNITVSADGQVFFTFHPDGRPEVKVATLVDGRAVPWPSAPLQSRRPDGPWFDTPLSLRTDGQGRLWTLDHGDHGLRQPRLLGFDVATGELLHHRDFGRHEAPLGSHLNDFQVDPSGRWLYIADASIIGKRPALVIYDVQTRQARRVLELHPSVTGEEFIPVVQGRKMLLFGLFAVRTGVDSIVLDREGRWLYFAPVTNRHLYRVETQALRNEALSVEALAEKVETFAPKPMSDGLAMDEARNIYITAIEHSAIMRMSPTGELETLVQDEALRWPDGLEFGPDGHLYVTASALHQVLLATDRTIREHAPYQIFRFAPHVTGEDSQAP